MRTRFDRQLEQLNVELIRMGALCEEAISIVAKSLLDSDLTYLPHALVGVMAQNTSSAAGKAQVWSLSK